MTKETDRELLEMAAKAAKIPLYWAEDDPECDWVQGNYPRIPNHQVLEHWTWKIWNPLTDDGDALRLAVRLGVTLELHPRWVYARAVIAIEKWSVIEEGWGNGGDPYAATRRAIVRAAAEIWRAMP